MGDLGVKKGRNNMKKEKFSSSTIKALPKELMVEVLARVASASITDLWKVKLTCKDFLHISEDNYVYQHASMENFDLVPLSWFTHEKELSFLNRCRESGNSEISYREGMVEYFSSMKVDSGTENLKKATMEGHVDSKYVYSMLLMHSEDEHKRKLGFDLFCSLKRRTSSTSVMMRRCRKRVKSFIRNMWINNPVVYRNNQEFLLCHSSTCESKRKIQELSRRWSWSSLIENEDDNDIIGSCQYCCADYELRLFCSMFEVH